MGNRRNYTYDVELELKAAGLVAASAAGSLIIDLKGGANVGTLGEGPKFEGWAIFDVAALEIASNDESYDLIIQGSPDADFGTAANIVDLCGIHLGAKETKRTDSDADDAVGRHIIGFCNERNGVFFQYLRVYTVVDGDIATGINYSARLAKLC